MLYRAFSAAEIGADLRPAGGDATRGAGRQGAGEVRVGGLCEGGAPPVRSAERPRGQR